MFDIDWLAFQHFHFMRPYWIFLLFLMVWILRTFTRRDDNLSLWRKIMSPEILNYLTVAGNDKNWLSPQKLSLFIIVPTSLLLMGPSWQQQPSPFSENNAGLVIALDLSETMAQNDIQPSRLLRAKQKILELLEIRGDTHTALIAFAGSAHVVMPMTTDKEMIRHFLASLNENIIPTKGKSPEKILPIAQRLLAPSNVPGTILVIGDGATENTVSLFSQYFSENRHQLIVWGIGVSSAANFNQGSSIIPMQLAQLENLSQQSNGRLVLMTHDKYDVDLVNRYIEHNLVIVDDNSRPWHDAGYPLVFVIALLFLFWFRKGWTLQW